MDTRRIRKHNHADDNSGGRLDGQAAVFTSGGASSGGGGSSSTSTGGLDAAGVLALGYFERVIEGGQSVIFPHGSMGSTETFDPTDGNVHTGTLTADCTFTLNVPTGSGACTLELRLTQDGTGGWDITWPGSVTLLGTLDTTASTEAIVILETLDGGTSWVAVVVGAGSEPTADAHIADATDAHDASAISIADAGTYYTGTDVEAALQEIGADLAASVGTSSRILLADGRATPFAFTDLLQMDDGSDFLYADP